MRRFVATPLLILAAVVLAASAALADGGSAPPPAPPSTPVESTRPMSPEEKAAIETKQAEDTYAAAWRDAEKAKQELAEAATLRAAGDAKSVKKAGEREAAAEKRLRKAAEKFAAVTTVLPRHADAWQMLGYARRMTGDLKGAFDAYWKALEIDPEHLGAHDYLGEAWLRAGKLDQAKAELAFLERKKAKEAAILAASIAAWEKSHPQPEVTTATQADSLTRTAPPLEGK